MSKTPILDRMIADAQRRAEEATENLADLEGLKAELAGRADEAERGATGSATQIRAERERPAGSESQQPTRPAPSQWDSLPWKKNLYGEWVYSNLPEARALVAKIGTAKTYADVDGYEYSLSGEGKKFLSRRKSK